MKKPVIQITLSKDQLQALESARAALVSLLESILLANPELDARCVLTVDAETDYSTWKKKPRTEWRIGDWSDTGTGKTVEEALNQLYEIREVDRKKKHLKALLDRAKGVRSEIRELQGAHA